MDKTIVIVEGPSGCGKTTYIQKMLNNVSEPGSVGQVNSVFSGERLPTNVVSSGITALRNDTNKLLTAVLMFLQEPNLEVVFVDRMVVSQMVYHELRTQAQRYQKRSLRFSISEVKTRLLGMCNYVNLMLPSYLSSYSNEEDYPELNIAIDLKLIVLSWEELQRRRSTSTREYPAGQQDHELYEYLYMRSGSDYHERVGQLVL